MKKRPIILVGGGGHCKSVIDVIESENKYEIIGILDIPEKVGNYILDYEIIGTEESLKHQITKCRYYLITIGHIKSAKLRIDLFNKVKRVSGILPNIISPFSHVSKNAKFGEGNIIMHSTIINSNVTIGNNCIINNQALIEHDCNIGNHVHVSTNANINGNCDIGEGSFIGSGSTVIQGIKIKENAIIGAGTVVINPVETGKTVIGNPGRTK